MWFSGYTSGQTDKLITTIRIPPGGEGGDVKSVATLPFPPPTGKQSIVMSLSVSGLSVCLSVRKHISETIHRTFTEFYWRYVALVVVLWCPALSSSASVTALR